jgi:hypothetical protein
MHGKLGDDIARHEVHPAGRLHVFPGVVPLRANLIHLLSGGILHSVLFVLVRGYKPKDLSRSGNHGGMQAEMAAVGQDELLECDGELMGRCEVLIQRV